MRPHPSPWAHFRVTRLGPCCLWAPLAAAAPLGAGPLLTPRLCLGAAGHSIPCGSVGVCASLSLRNSARPEGLSPGQLLQGRAHACAWAAGQTGPRFPPLPNGTRRLPAPQPELRGPGGQRALTTQEPQARIQPPPPAPPGTPRPPVPAAPSGTEPRGPMAAGGGRGGPTPRGPRGATFWVSSPPWPPPLGGFARAPREDDKLTRWRMGW